VGASACTERGHGVGSLGPRIVTRSTDRSAPACVSSWWPNRLVSKAPSRFGWQMGETHRQIVRGGHAPSWCIAPRATPHLRFSRSTSCPAPVRAPLQDCKRLCNDLKMFFTLAKKETGYWPRLTKEKQRVGWQRLLAALNGLSISSVHTMPICPKRVLDGLTLASRVPTVCVCVPASLAQNRLRQVEG